MESREGALGPATTRFSDYVGTVEADDAEAVLGRPSLYELANIDRDRYTIVGMDLVVDDSKTATVYPFARCGLSVGRLDEIIELGQRRGEIPVVRFDIPEIDVRDFIRYAFRRISVRFLTQPLPAQCLVAGELGPTEDLEP